ncbi:Uncharacterized protein APZ42_032978 [Daphnia magna]|uniref:Uncharacterized protein n=1 Tax=Daphnia magna TaxID=35525 RepID=A0A164LIF1_9CRUS|nr:Uncharacterized protein APZ42_032978 [Daphnia magna]
MSPENARDFQLYLANFIHLIMAATTHIVVYIVKFNVENYSDYRCEFLMVYDGTTGDEDHAVCS